MHASIGDHVVVEGTRPGSVRREGEIVALHHKDGTPPYDVTWSDSGHTTVCVPGPDAHIQHAGSGAAGSKSAGAR